MDAFSDPEIEIVVVFTSSQVGKTTIIENVDGYFIDQDPSPILNLEPTLDVAKSLSKDRLTPMFRDSPCLKGKISDVKSRDPDNTTLHKVFTGGHLTIAGANSAASLGSRPIRILLMDEVDRYPASAGVEGDPCRLAVKRTTAFWNRKIGYFSTGTIKGQSKIETMYGISDKRKYFVPCPHCGEKQILKWAQIKWPKDEQGRHKPEETWYECISCSGKITDMDKPQMLRDGEWRAECETRGIAGFWLNELYSPWVSFGNMVQRFLEAKKAGREVLKVFINTSLAETWDEGESSVDDTALGARRERYGPELPAGVLLLVAGVDIQVDRIECEVKGYGFNEESWGIEYKILLGDPKYEQVWKDLNEYLLRTWRHMQGINLSIAGACIDSGYLANEVYTFVRSRQFRRVFGQVQRILAVKGANDPLKPLINRPSRVGMQKVHLFSLGVNEAKEIINSRMKITEPGPGYMHFPFEYDDEYFSQLTNEHAIREKGVRRWVPRTAGAKVEALDIQVYALAALRILNPNWERLLENHEKRLKEFRKEKPEIPDEQEPQGRRVINAKRIRRHDGWATRW